MHSNTHNPSVNANASVRLPPINVGIGETSGAIASTAADVNKSGMVSNTANSQTLIYRSIPPKPQNFTLSDMIGPGITPPTAVKSKKLGMSGNTPSEFAKRFMTRPSTQPKVIEFNVGRIKADRRRRGINGFFPPVKLRLSAKSQPTPPITEITNCSYNPPLSRTQSLETVRRDDTADNVYSQLTYESRDNVYMIYGRACDRRNTSDQSPGGKDRTWNQRPVLEEPYALNIAVNEVANAQEINYQIGSNVNNEKKDSIVLDNHPEMNLYKPRYSQLKVFKSQHSFSNDTIPEVLFTQGNKGHKRFQTPDSELSKSLPSDNIKPESTSNSKYSKATKVNTSDNKSVIHTTTDIDSSVFDNADRNRNCNKLKRTKSDPNIRYGSKKLSATTNLELNAVSEMESNGTPTRSQWPKSHTGVMNRNVSMSIPSVRSKSHTGTKDGAENKLERSRSDIGTVTIELPEREAQTKHIITREGYTVHKLRTDRFPPPPGARLQLVPTSFSEVRPRSSSRSLSRSSMKSRQSTHNRKTPDSVRTAPPTDVTLVYPETFECDDLSYLPPPKRILPKRDVPWVFRYKVKKNMNELSKIMASKPQHLIDV